MKLEYNDALHEYRLNGVVVPSVTQILRPLYDFSMVNPEVLERKRQLGKAVHKAIELSLAGDLDESSISEDWRGYFEGWQRFVGDHGLTDAVFGDIETPFGHPIFGYAGTPDLTLPLNGSWGVLDVKTTAELSPVVALQTAAYLELINENSKNGAHKIRDRYALRLLDNRTYRLEQYRDKGDWGVFLACLTTYKWRAKHGI